MSKLEQSQAEKEIHFTLDQNEVFTVEKATLEERRRRNGLPSLDEDGALWGLAFSGGGVRSATFCLGVLQALVGSGCMKRFDYLSTVSGGGYIGSCLSSLLSGRDDTGLDPEISPFNGLRALDDYADPENTKLSVRHQMHHLRTHGEYLIPRSNLLSRDVQRAIGTVLPGMAHTVVLFLLLFVACVAAVHLVLTPVESDLASLAPTAGLVIEGADDMNALEYVGAVSKAWFEQRLAPPFKKMASETGSAMGPLLAAVALGILWCAAAVVVATRLGASFDPVDHPPTNATRAGWTTEDEREARFVWRFNVWSVLVAVVLMMGTAAGCRIASGANEFLAALLLPLAFATGGLFSSFALTHTLQSRYARKGWIPGARSTESRFRRSLYASLRGASLYGMAAAVGVPVLLVVLFSLSDLPLKFFWSLAALAVAYYSSRRAGGAAAMQLGGWLQRPVANIAVLVFVAFGFAQVSAWLISWYRSDGAPDVWLAGSIAFVVSLVLFFGLGVLVDANRISPHYFYRDRLTEAYLKTDARTVRPSTDAQGMPLTVLRDDEDLRLSDLGKGNGRGPYHLIVAAMNLSGSKELNRKSFLSEHFIFSRDFIGSRVTGWAATRVYRRNTTRLARAMAISAAAVGSAMGPNTFAAQAFVTTLFNARLGFWTENPWCYRHGDPDKRRSGLTFWPRYLLYEVLRQTTAEAPKVNVSDGGHTGDNVALLPLLQRRCATIVVCDGEADGELSFGSFNNAVRMAFIEENIEIDIDLTPVMDREETAAGFSASTANVVVGDIRYPATIAGEPGFTGKLVYIKASIPLEDIPVHVANYAKGHETFPHETTADQFFDDAQFEAYRALGERLGRSACEALSPSGSKQRA